MEENFYKVGNDENINMSDTGMLDSSVNINNEEIVQENTVTKNGIVKIQSNSDTLDKGTKSNFTSHVEKLPRLNKNTFTENLDSLNTKCIQNDFIFSNTLFLIIIAIFSLVYSYNAKKNNALYEFKNRWLIFMLFLISCFAAITNFPIKIGDNYRMSIYMNQFIMFLFGILVIYNILCSNRNHD